MLHLVSRLLLFLSCPPFLITKSCICSPVLQSFVWLYHLELLKTVGFTLLFLIELLPIFSPRMESQTLNPQTERTECFVCHRPLWISSAPGFTAVLCCLSTCLSEHLLLSYGMSLTSATSLHYLLLPNIVSLDQDC